MAEGRDMHATAEDRLRFLAEIGPRLASELDWRVVLREVCELAVPLFADWCIADIQDVDGQMRRVAVVAAPDQRAIVDELMAQPLSAQGLGAGVAKSGQSLLLTEPPAEVPVIQARTMELARELGVASVVLVPLRTRARSLGVMTFAMGRSGRRYDPTDVAFLEIVASRAAIAVDNASLLEGERLARRQAEGSRGELETLFALTEHANRATRAEEVYQPALDAITRLCHVDRAAILLFDPDDVLRFKAWRGLSDEYRAALTGHTPWRPDTADAQPIVVADWRDEPSLARFAPALEAERIRGVAFVPMIHAGAVLGKFMLYDAAPRTFTEHEVQLAELAAAQVAQAVVRGRLIDREREARTVAERQADRTRRLQRVTARLSNALAEGEIADIVLGEGAGALAAHSAGIWTVAGDALALLGTHGYAPAVQETVRTLPLDAGIPITDAVVRREPVWLEDVAAYAARYPMSAERTRSLMPGHDVAIACLPLALEGRPVGALAFTFDSARRFDDEERTFLELLAQNCAQAMDRARLYGAEHAGRERAAFLAEASALLAASLDVRTTLQNVADLAVPRIADWCVVDLDAPDVRDMLAAVAHVDPEKRAMTRTWRDMSPPRRDAPTGVFRVIQTGTSELYPEIPEAMIEAVENVELREVARSLQLRSALIAPILAHGRTLGAISLIYSESGRRYSAEDLAVIEQLGERAGVALANAKLFEQVGKLQRVTAAFGASTTVQDVARVAVELTRELLGGRVVAVSLLTEDGRHLRGVDHTELGERVQEMQAAVDEPVIGAEVVRTGQAIYVESAAAYAERYPVSRWGPASGAVAMVPLHVRGQVAGTLGVGFDGDRALSPEDRAFLEAVADQCAQAIDRARTHDQAVRAVAVRDDFLSVAGHELKTPLTALLLQTQALARGVTDEQVVARVDKLVRHIGRLGKLIDELLDVSRITSGRLHLELEDVDLTALVVENVGRLSDEASRAGSAVQLAIDGELRGRWDRTRIDQVVSNLLSNAIKYGQGRPIDVAASRAQDRAVVVVRDRGIGIAAEDQARIFGRFERAVSSRHFGGLGLGLWIVRQIVEAHGGTIAVVSAPGEGAEFRVELPFTPAASP
jgi:GAF domain-containing protein